MSFQENLPQQRSNICMPKLSAALVGTSLGFSAHLMLQAFLGASKGPRKATQTSTTSLKQSTGKVGIVDRVMKKVNMFVTMLSNAPFIGPAIRVMGKILKGVRASVFSLVSKITKPLNPFMT